MRKGRSRHHRDDLAGLGRDGVVDVPARIGDGRTDAAANQRSSEIVEVTHPLGKVPSIGQATAGSEKNDGASMGPERRLQVCDVARHTGSHTLELARRQTGHETVENLAERIFRSGELALNVNDDECRRGLIESCRCLLLDAQQLLNSLVVSQCASPCGLIGQADAGEARLCTIPGWFTPHDPVVLSGRSVRWRLRAGAGRQSLLMGEGRGLGSIARPGLREDVA